MKREKINRVAPVLGYIILIAVNILANSIPIGGQTTGEVSEMYPSLFTPAGFTFSIWGIIYIGLALYVVYQALPGQGDKQVLAEVSPYFVINGIANASWILAWHYDYLILSLIVMAIILVTLILIYRRLLKELSYSAGMRWLVKIPFSIYLGWITVATIANISILQTAFQYEAIFGISEINWTIIKLALAGAIGAIMILRFRDIAFVLVVAWAAYGISVGEAETLPVFGAARLLIVIALLLIIFETSKILLGFSSKKK